ncbi:hypothetical protein CPB86DRAFT_814929 [Serendipita vermifera]|nr:hypothetical protein CPB86DRAFT_814929 [Serendipita vermifera]
MTGQLIAPRPVRLGANFHLPFFLSNALPALSPAAPSAPVGLTSSSSGSTSNEGYGHGHGALLLENVAQHTQAQSLLPASAPSEDATIEDLAAKISLDDHASPPALASSSSTTANGAAGAATNNNNTHNPQPSPSTSNSFPARSSITFIRGYTTSPAAHHHKYPTESPSNSTCWILEDPALSLPPSRSPEAAALDEFLSILRPVIRAPSSPIARSKKLIPRSRHNHHGLTLGGGSAATNDRHHPYMRSAKSSSPHTEAFEASSGSTSSKRGSGGRSGTFTKRRSSNANDSSYSGESTSICSSRSQSVSRRASDESLSPVNAWRSACE